MSESSTEPFRATVESIFDSCFGAAAGRLNLAVDEDLHAAVARAYPGLNAEQAGALAFHLSDWRADAAFLVALSLAPKRFTAEEIENGLAAFLVHAPNHVAAAAKLSGWPIRDIFGVGALDAALEDRDPAI